MQSSGVGPTDQRNAAYRFDPANQTHGRQYLDANSKFGVKADKKCYRSAKHASGGNKRTFERVLVEGLQVNALDPRKDALRFQKCIERSPLKASSKIHPVRWAFDKHSIGERPCLELVVWNLDSITTSTILKNNFISFGSIQDVKIIEDPETALSLGMGLITFDDEDSKGHERALQAMSDTNRKLTIQGRTIRCGLNTNNEIFNQIYSKTMEAKEQHKKQMLLKETQQQQYQNKPGQKNQQNHQISSIKLKYMHQLTPHYKHIKPTSLAIKTSLVQRHLLHQPFILVEKQFVDPANTSKSFIRNWLSNYKLHRISFDDYGFYITFDSLEAAERCFEECDGQTFWSGPWSFKLFMTLFIPDDMISNSKIGLIYEKMYPSVFKREPKINTPNPALTKPSILPIPPQPFKDDARIVQTNGSKPRTKEESAQVIKNELGTYLTQDIYANNLQRIINKVLDSDAVQLKRKEWEEKKKSEAEDRRKGLKSFENKVSTAKVVKSLDVSLLIGKKKPGIIKKAPPVIKKEIELNDRKRKLSFDENGEEQQQDQEEPKDHESNDGTSHTSDSETPPTTSVEPEIKSEAAVEEEEEKPKVATHVGDDKFGPSHGKPVPVYDDSDLLANFKPTISWLKSSIKSEEDFEIIKRITANNPKTPIKNLDYWAWKRLSAHDDYRKLKNMTQVEDQEQEFDFAYETKINPSLRNATGSFGTEPYKKIPDSNKSQYLIHRRRLTQLNPIHETQDEENTSLTSHNSISSSRVNRANDRRFAQDINSIAGGNLELNKLSKRKKPVQFARSAIHNWGLYALENISAGEMIIEYVGERIRQQVAELREKKYLRLGIGSSYLFRVDENTVIDASKKGGIARFINHCCEPSCTAKIIKVDGSKRIVIYALRDVRKNEELTYDYKFERETNDEERIRCLCGAPGCKGFLN